MKFLRWLFARTPHDHQIDDNGDCIHCGAPDSTTCTMRTSGDW